MIRQHVMAVYDYKDFIFASIRREFEITYLNSALGAIWTVIHPLALIFIYAVVFSKIMQARLPTFDGPYGYSVYLCTGILLWTLFSEIALKAQVVFIEQANLMKKVNFPRLCLPVVVVGNGLVRFVIVVAGSQFRQVNVELYPAPRPSPVPVYCACSCASFAFG